MPLLCVSLAFFPIRCAGQLCYHKAELFGGGGRLCNHKLSCILSHLVTLSLFSVLIMRAHSRENDTRLQWGGGRNGPPLFLRLFSAMTTKGENYRTSLFCFNCEIFQTSSKKSLLRFRGPISQRQACPIIYWSTELPYPEQAFICFHKGLK